MATAQVEMLEMRFRIEPNWTTCFVQYGPTSDGTLGVQGWHAKRFPPEIPIVDIITNEMAAESPMLWPQEAPNE